MMSLAGSYNEYYETPNYFRYHEWIYRPYISSLLSVAGLHSGSSVLDVGCGQGFFSYLIRRCGLKVYGLDVSEQGLRKAQHAYSSLGIRFVLGDVKRTPFAHKFDSVFARSLSLYNCEDFATNCWVTDVLLGLIREKGTLMFLYNTNLNPSRKKGQTWRYHSVEDVYKHFSHYSRPLIFFVSKLDTLILRRHAFNRIPSTVNSFMSRKLGLGGDLVCILKKD